MEKPLNEVARDQRSRSKPQTLKARLLAIYTENRPAPKSAAGRRPKVNPAEIAFWRQRNKASIAQTSKHFGVDPKTVTTACRKYGPSVLEERQRFGAAQRRMRELADIEEDEAIAARAAWRAIGFKKI